MENIKKKTTSIDILAEMTRRDMERSLQIKDVNNVKANWTPRHGWHLKKNESESSKVWQDDYK